MRLTSGKVREVMPKNLLGYSFRIKGKVRTEENFLLSLLRFHASIISSSSSLGMGVFSSLHGQVRSTNNCFTCVQRACLFFLCIKDEIINFINLLSLLGGMWVSYHHCFIVVGYTSCFYCMILLLSKPAWFCV